MNEYIVQIISATRLWLISRYSHHTLKKRWKMTISPIVWYCCDIWRPYKISSILYKTNEKAISFLSTSGMSRDLSRVHSFSRPHGVSLFGNIERCVVVSFSGATSVQWSDVEHALCAFSWVCWDYFQVFHWFGCAKWKYCEKWHLLSGLNC